MKGQQEACKSGGACRAPVLDPAALREQSPLCGLSWLTLSSVTNGPLYATLLPPCLCIFGFPCTERSLSLFVLTPPSIQPGSPPPHSMEASPLTQGGLLLPSSGGKGSGRPPAGWFVCERETDRQIWPSGHEAPLVSRNWNLHILTNSSPGWRCPVAGQAFQFLESWSEKDLLDLPGGQVCGVPRGNDLRLSGQGRVCPFSVPASRRPTGLQVRPCAAQWPRLPGDSHCPLATSQALFKPFCVLTHTILTMTLWLLLSPTLPTRLLRLQGWAHWP